MEQLVFVKDQSLNSIPFTTDEVIAEYSGNSLHAVKQMIRSNESNLKEFGVLAFEMRKPKAFKGGRPKKVFRLNQEQSTFLITLLDNTPQVVKFKLNLVKQFFTMDRELSDARVKREAGKYTTTMLTDAIKARTDLDTHAYINFNQLAYMAALGKSATKLKKERLVPNNTPATEYLTGPELDKLNKVKQHMAALIEMGMDYHAIKALVSGSGVITFNLNKTAKGA
jgi:phage regulator Rha-like protein